VSVNLTHGRFLATGGKIVTTTKKEYVMSDTATLSVKPAPPKAAETKKTNILNASHRCDRCSAAAYVLVNLKESDKLKNGGSLLFCGHHFNKFEAALLPFMDGNPIDERHKLVYDRHTGTENS